MSTGKVEGLNADEGYGVITTHAGQDLFVHYSEIQTNGFRTLEEGSKVSFEINTNDRGDHAANVTVI